MIFHATKKQNSRLFLFSELSCTILLVVLFLLLNNLPSVAQQTTQHMIISSFLSFNTFDLVLCIFKLSSLLDSYELLEVKESVIYEHTALYLQHLACGMHSRNIY